MLSLANNHILEHGAPVLAETRSILDEGQVAHAGLSGDGGRDRAVHRWRQNGYQLAFYADSLVRDISGRKIDEAASEAWLLDSLAADTADIRIVSLHWGDEYVTMPSSRQRRLGRRLIEGGAQLVLGHHPHVLQPVEEYRGGLIAYSLGNFLFDQDWTDATRRGGILDLSLDPEGVHEWTFHGTSCVGGGELELLRGEAAEAVAALIAGDPEGDDQVYDQALRSASRHHRLQMKLELIRHFWRVSPDTIHFLLTKRRRPRPVLGGQGESEQA